MHLSLSHSPSLTFPSKLWGAIQIKSRGSEIVVNTARETAWVRASPRERDYSTWPPTWGRTSLRGPTTSWLWSRYRVTLSELRPWQKQSASNWETLLGSEVSLAVRSASLLAEFWWDCETQDCETQDCETVKSALKQRCLEATHSWCASLLSKAKRKVLQNQSASNCETRFSLHVI